MITVSKQSVIDAAPNRPDGYLDYIRTNSGDDGDNFLIPDDVFENVLIGHYPKPRGLGDVVESAAKPIAKALGLKCLDPEGNLKPQSKCAKRRDWLNRVTGRKDVPKPTPSNVATTDIRMRRARNIFTLTNSIQKISGTNDGRASYENLYLSLLSMQIASSQHFATIFN